MKHISKSFFSLLLSMLFAVCTLQLLQSGLRVQQHQNALMNLSPSELGLNFDNNSFSLASSVLFGFGIVPDINTTTQNSALDSLRQKINVTRVQKPPNTIGAFIHVGKTGGSTLSSMLRYGCHSFVKKPCGYVKDASIVSRTTTYYHTPDWSLLPKYNYSYYVWTIRDPFSRTVSAFLYGHPYNVQIRKEVYGDKVYNYPFKKLLPIYERCFPTLDAFALSLSNYSKTHHIQRNETSLSTSTSITKEMDCQIVAEHMLNQRELSEHLFYDLRMFSKQVPINKQPIFAIRTETLWKDWQQVNLLLGQEANTIEGESFRNSSAYKLPVIKNISAIGKKYICDAIQDEYKVYFHILANAININEQDLIDMIQLAKSHCPTLTFWKRSED